MRMETNARFTSVMAFDGGGGGLTKTQIVYVKPENGAQIYNKITSNLFDVAREDAKRNISRYKVASNGQFMSFINSTDQNTLKGILSAGGVYVDKGTVWYLADNDYGLAKQKYKGENSKIVRYVQVAVVDKGRKLEVKLPEVDGYYQINGGNTWVKKAHVTTTAPSSGKQNLPPGGTKAIIKEDKFEPICITDIESGTTEGSGDTQTEPTEAILTPFSLEPNLESNGFSFSGNEGLRKHIAKYYNTFGAPFLYLNSTDICYYENESIDLVKIGRSQLSTIYSHPTVFSICPGKVTYLPHVGTKKKTSILDEIMQKGQAISVAEEAQVKASGPLAQQLYEFSSNYADYINRLNVCARVASVMMGIGDRPMPYSNASKQVKYRAYDYGYYTTDKRGQQHELSIEFGGIIDEILWQLKTAAESTANDDQYIHFFVNNEGTQMTESHTVETTDNPMDGVLNNQGMQDTIKSMTFLLGGAMSDEGGILSGIKGDIEQLKSEIQKAGGNSSIVSSLIDVMDGYVKGGRMVVPDMIDRVSFEQSMDCTLYFKSLTGDPEDVFLRCILPSLAILNFAWPKQLTNNMYGYPYVVKCYQRGMYNTDLAVIGNVRVERGGSDNISWSQHGIPTELKVSFSITPLYSELMGGNGQNPFLFMDNGPLLEYLGNLCGLDLNVSQFDMKMDLFNTIISNKISDIGITPARAMGSAIADKFSGIFSFK